MRVLAAALRRDVGDRAFQDLQERLLHTLARHIPRDRRVVRLAGNLVDLVDVDDPPLGVLDGGLEAAALGGLNEAQEDILHILADVAGLRERGRIHDGKWHVQHARQGLGEQRLAGAGRADQQDIALGYLHIARRQIDPFEVVVDGDRQRPLGSLLSHDVLSQDLHNLLGFGQRFEKLVLVQRIDVTLNHIVTEVDTFDADAAVQSQDQLRHLLLGLAAEHAAAHLVPVDGGSGQGRFAPSSQGSWVRGQQSHRRPNRTDP